MSRSRCAVFDIVCFYADLGRDYPPLLERFCRSAKKVMPGHALICATPTPEGNIGKLWDHVVPLPRKADVTNLCLERARFTVSWMLHARDMAIFADPDIEFLRPIPIEGLEDVNVMVRKHKIDQPINSGIIIAKPGPREFWLHYGRVTVNLPEVLHHWWCDQLAINLMVGVCHKAGEVLKLDDATVKLLDGSKLCPNSDSPTEMAWALHYKGGRKGPGWDKVYVPKSKSGAGKSWQGSVSSTGIVEGPNSASPPDDSRSIFVHTFPPSP